MSKIIIIGVLCLLVVIILYKLVYGKTNKDIRNLYDECVEEFTKMLYDNLFSFTNEAVDAGLKTYMNEQQSRNNFKEVIKDIYLPFYYRNKYFKLLTNDKKLEILSTAVKKMPETVDETIIDQEKFYIGSGIFANYFFNKIFESGNEVSIYPYTVYMKTEKYNPFSEFKIGNNCVASHHNDIYTVDNNNNFKPGFIYNSRGNYYAFTLFTGVITHVTKQIDEEYSRDELREIWGIHSLDDLKEYKSTYSSKIKEKCGKSFDDILSNDEHFPILYLNDLPLVDNSSAKILMYLDTKESKISFKTLIKEEDCETYHTTNKNCSYPSLLTVQYAMYLQSFIYTSLLFIKGEKKDDKVV